LLAACMLIGFAITTLSDIGGDVYHIERQELDKKCRRHFVHVLKNLNLRFRL
jgi:hypothetical protein